MIIKVTAMLKMKNIAFTLLTAILFVLPLITKAQKKDTTLLSKIKPYTEVITAKAQTDDGLFKVHKVEAHYYFEIPDSLLGREMILVSRIAKGAAEYGTHAKGIGFAGDQFGEGVVLFEKGPDKQIFMRQISYLERSGDTTENGLSRSVRNSNIQPIIGAYPIKAYSLNKKGTVIEVTDLINGDNEVLYFGANDKKALSLGKLEADRSYIETVHSFPMNVEIRAIKTYLKTAAPGAASLASGAVTYGLSASLVLLPKSPMKARYFDNRVGYFSNEHVNYDADPQGVKNVKLITRWRLEPKKEDLEKYKRGELVEPEKPIVIYIDPATPKKWVPYLIQGINDWQVAFEQAGFKNAIVGRAAPANNPEWSMEDARHSVIVYKPANIKNASGPHVHDPRSGEILETHINWYHNVMKLLHDWYFVQCAVVDPRARKMEFDDQLMGELIRFVSSHEVGHTLGLSHNFGASSTVPVEKLRDKKWVEENGHTPSIMDYARFNYVAQPEDNIGIKGLYPRIGVYDKWAIEWGYRWFPELKTAAAEKPVLNKWVIQKLSKNPYLWFADDRPEVGLAFDPRVNSEILGDDVMKSSEYGIRNLKKLKEHLLDWSKTPGEDYTNAGNMYGAMYLQLMTYNRNVARHIGGMMRTNKTADQGGPVYEFVPRKTQKEAMAFLQRNLFATTPDWLIDAKLQELTLIGGEASKVSFLQTAGIDALFNRGVFDRLINFEMERPGEAYTATEMLNDMKAGVWAELLSHQPIGIFRRNLQTNYTVWLTSLVKFSGKTTGASRFTDATAVIREHLRVLAADIRSALPAIKDAPSQTHLRNILDNLEAELVLPKLMFTAPY